MKSLPQSQPCHRVSRLAPIALAFFAIMFETTTRAQTTSDTIAVTDSKIYRDDKLGITLITGDLELPADMRYWRCPEKIGALHWMSCNMLEPVDWLDFNSGKRQKGVGRDDDDAAKPTKPAKLTRRFAITAQILPSGGAEKTIADFEITNPDAKTSLRIHWDWVNADSGHPDILKAWSTQRAYRFAGLSQTGNDGTLREIAIISNRVYGSDVGNFYDDDRNSRFGDTPSILALIGGRAAVDETLQLRELRDENRRTNRDNDSGTAAATNAPKAPVPLASIEGVEVKSHPFEKMLADSLALSSSGKTSRAHSPSLSVSLADCVPADRAFFHAAKPSAMRALLSDSSPSMRRIAALANSDMNMEIFERYSAALGLTPPLAQMLWEKSLAEEYAVFTPDLFFADGTDVTLIARTKSAVTFDTLLKPLLVLVGSASEKDGLLSIPTATKPGEKADAKTRAWWSSRGELIFMSTSETELRRALALCDAKGAGSLGQSAEYRYMLLKLPDTAATEGRVYLSDPFLRRLVGPEVKIGQFRRALARLDMEKLITGALLRRIDLPDARDSLETLAKLGYVETNASAGGDITFDPETITVRSATFGPLARMYPLSAQRASLENVSAAEAAAYKRYMENYSNFWSEYFDPIALRLDAGEKTNSHQLETFILPLVENTIYNALREWVTASPGEVKTPVFDREPVAMASGRLPEKTWESITPKNPMLGSPSLFMNGKFFDLLGPTVHFAVVDAAPVMRMGAGGANDTFRITRELGGRNAMFMAPVAALALTRPCQLVIELSDAKAAAQYLNDASISKGFSNSREWMNLEWTNRAENEWILSLNLAGLINMDFSVRVENGFLVVSNFPWDNPLRVTGSRPGALSGLTLEYWPRAMNLSLPSDYATAMKAERAQAAAGMTKLFPWALAFKTDPQAALAAAQRSLGAVPVFPKGALSWREYDLWHERFGSIWRPQMPAFDKSIGDFGTFDSVGRVSASMQFEDDGLRTRLDWETTR